MTSSSTSLSDYCHVDTPHNVTLANGSLSTVAGSGHTHLSPDIELFFFKKKKKKKNYIYQKNPKGRNTITLGRSKRQELPNKNPRLTRSPTIAPQN
jgi:ribosomal protein L24E